MLKIRVRASFPQKGVEKIIGSFLFCKANNKLFKNMPNMVKNVKTNSNLLNERKY